MKYSVNPKTRYSPSGDQSPVEKELPARSVQRQHAEPKLRWWEEAQAWEEEPDIRFVTSLQQVSHHIPNSLLAHSRAEAYTRTLKIGRTPMFPVDRAQPVKIRPALITPSLLRHDHRKGHT
jgi:hypothetical protein